MTGIIMGGTMLFGGAIGLSACGDPEAPPPELKVTKSGGYEEGAYVNFSVPETTTSVEVSYKLNGASEYTKIDGELIRKNAGGYRADIVGLKEGTYTIKVDDKTANKTVEVADVAVTSYDRSGYADFGVNNLTDKTALKGDYLGAYNKDGTLKEDAEVVYVTEETKNTVSVEWDKTYTGIANILYNLKSAGHPVAVRVIGRISTNTWNELSYAEVLESDGSLAIENLKGKNGESLEEYVKTKYAFGNSTTLNDINETRFNSLKSLGVKLYTAKKLETYAENFVEGTTTYYTNWDLSGKTQNVLEGEIISQGWNTLNDNIERLAHDMGTANNGSDALQTKVQYTATKASVAWNSDDTFKNTITAAKFDSSFNNCWIMGASGENNYINVTLEGIGTDAELFQWGVSWKRVSSVEVRNLTFTDYNEDACSFEGVTTNWTDPDDNNATKFFWVHNNTFNRGKNYWDVTDEQDKGDGDGATDFKGNSYITVSYNHYKKNHKTGLVGGGDSHADANITFHHNFYDESESRLPLARMANMHMYNNYYYKSGYSISLRSTAYAFVENCYFENNTRVFDYSGTNWTAKVIGCEFINSPYTSDAATPVNIVFATSRDEEVISKNTYNAKFDIDPDFFYCDATTKETKVTRLTNATQAKQDCINLAGVHKN